MLFFVRLKTKHILIYSQSTYKLQQGRIQKFELGGGGRNII